MVEEISSFKQEPIIKNSMTGKNRGHVSEWFDPEKLNELLDVAESGDLLEIDRLAFSHWGIYAGRDVDLNGGQEAYIVHLGLDTDSPPGDSGHGKLKPTVNFNKLVDVIRESRVRVNNSNDRLIEPATNIDLINQRIKLFKTEHDAYHFTERNCEIFAKYCRNRITDYSGQYEMAIGLLTIILVRNMVYAVDSMTELISATCIVGFVFGIFYYEYTPIVIRKFQIMISSLTGSRDTQPEIKVVTDNSPCAISNKISVGRIWPMIYRVVISLTLLSTNYVVGWLVVMNVVAVRYVASVLGETCTACVAVQLQVVYMVAARYVNFLRRPKELGGLSIILLGVNCFAYTLAYTSSLLYLAGALISAVGLLRCVRSKFDGTSMAFGFYVILAVPVVVQIALLPTYIIILCTFIYFLMD